MEELSVEAEVAFICYNRWVWKDVSRVLVCALTGSERGIQPLIEYLWS